VGTWGECAPKDVQKRVNVEPVSSCYRGDGDDRPSVGPVPAGPASGLIYGSRTVHTSPGAPFGPARAWPGRARRQKVNNGQAAGRCMGGVSGQCPGLRASWLHGFMGGQKHDRTDCARSIQQLVGS